MHKPVVRVGAHLLDRAIGVGAPMVDPAAASVRLFLFRSFFRNPVTYWNFSWKKEQNTPSNRAFSFLFYSFFQNPVTFWEFPLKKEQSTPLTRAFSFLFRSFFQNPVTFSNYCSKKERELIPKGGELSNLTSSVCPLKIPIFFLHEWYNS